MELILHPEKTDRVKEHPIFVSKNIKDIIKMFAKNRDATMGNSVEYLIMKGLEAEYSEQKDNET